MVWKAGKAMWKAIYSFPVTACSGSHPRKLWMGELYLHAGSHVRYINLSGQQPSNCCLAKNIQYDVGTYKD